MCRKLAWMLGIGTWLCGASGSPGADLVRLEVAPAEHVLSGPREQLQLLVTGVYDDGQVRDLTREAEYSAGDDQVARVQHGVVRPLGNGRTSAQARVGSLEASAAIGVEQFDQPQPVSFQYGTLAALSKQGCNAGACHGSPSGKAGFRLSLRAFDPKLDQLTLIREAFGRRTNPLQPEESLLLRKPLMHVPHGGGRQLTTSDPAYSVLRDWIAEGCRLDPPDAARCVSVEVLPESGRVLHGEHWRQQLSVQARFSDGTTRDVTELAVFSSSHEAVAGVSPSGLVTGKKRGETAIVVRYLEFVESTFLTFVRDVEGFHWNDPPVNNYIDRLAYDKLRRLQYLPSETCTDDEFVRRVHLDVTGLLPTVDEARRFLEDDSTEKRARLIDELLERPEHAAFWALKWGDLLRMTSGQVGADAVHKYHRWLVRALRDNMPYDEFARQLLTATGSTLSNPPANFYRTSADHLDSVETISQVFLGARLQCAKCHNHPFERWTQDNYYGMAAFFNRVQRKKSSRADELIIFSSNSGEVTQPRTGQKMQPWAPGAGDVSASDSADRRQLFAKWLTAEDNPFFAKIEVNRIWSHLLGRGIVEPADDFRDTNPPANAELLDALAEDFIRHGYDRRHILRTILNSRTYQASYRVNELNEDDTRFFSHYHPRMLAAEQLLDGICQVTGVPEQFAGLPPGTRATQLPAPDLVKNEFLKTFGQPERQTVCACERTKESNLGMAIQFFNGSKLGGKVTHSDSRFRKLAAAGASDEQIVEELYLAAVARPASAEELQTCLSHIAAKQQEAASPPDRRLPPREGDGQDSQRDEQKPALTPEESRLRALEDICWAVLNSNEFLFQH